MKQTDATTRHQPRRGARLACAALLAATWSAPAAFAAAEASWQPHADIRAAAVAAVRAELDGVFGRTEVIAGELDARLKLPRCSGELDGDVPFSGSNRARRVTAEVRCEGEKPWKIYVPVRLTIFENVLVAARALPRGTVLTPADILLAETDVADLGYGYISAEEHAVGNRLRRALAAGDALTPGALERPATVKRGQRLTLEARNGTLTVRMAGVALSDGLIGDVIDVENLTSQRHVQAIVRSPQAAEVLLP